LRGGCEEDVDGNKSEKIKRKDTRKEEKRKERKIKGGTRTRRRERR
jgi:hypothetical protein